MWSSLYTGPNHPSSLSPNFPHLLTCRQPLPIQRITLIIPSVT